MNYIILAGAIITFYVAILILGDSPTLAYLLYSLGLVFLICACCDPTTKYGRI